MKKLTLIALLVFPLLVFACGPCGEKTSKDKLQDSAQTIIAAGESGDWQTFCDLLTTQSQEKLTVLLRVKKGTSCLDAIKQRESLVGQRIKDQAASIDINKVRAEKTTGRVFVNTPTGEQFYLAFLVDGEWRINLFP